MGREKHSRFLKPILYRSTEIVKYISRVKMYNTYLMHRNDKVYITAYPKYVFFVRSCTGPSISLFEPIFRLMKTFTYSIIVEDN